MAPPPPGVRGPQTRPIDAAGVWSTPHDVNAGIHLGIPGPDPAASRRFGWERGSTLPPPPGRKLVAPHILAGTLLVSDALTSMNGVAWLWCRCGKPRSDLGQESPYGPGVVVAALGFPGQPPPGGELGPALAPFRGQPAGQDALFRDADSGQAAVDEPSEGQCALFGEPVGAGFGGGQPGLGQAGPEPGQRERGVGNFPPPFAATRTRENRQGRKQNFRPIRPLGARLVTGRGYGSQRIQYRSYFAGVGDAQERGKLGEGRA